MTAEPFIATIVNAVVPGRGDADRRSCLDDRALIGYWCTRLPVEQLNRVCAPVSEAELSMNVLNVHASPGRRAATSRWFDRSRCRGRG